MKTSYIKLVIFSQPDIFEDAMWHVHTKLNLFSNCVGSGINTVFIINEVRDLILYKLTQGSLIRGSVCTVNPSYGRTLIKVQSMKSPNYLAAAAINEKIIFDI